MAETVGLKVEDPRFWDPAAPARRDRPDLRHLPQLPALLQILRQLPDPVRAHRRQDRGACAATTWRRIRRWSRPPSASAARRRGEPSPAGRAGGRGRGDLRRRAARAARARPRPHGRRDRPRRRPLLPVQALLPELPVHAAARVRDRLPAPAAALEGAPHAPRRACRCRRG